MPEHRIHWTALPRRADPTHLELDVFVSPRLGTDAVEPEYKLGEFPELASWTERVGDGEVSFGVSFDGGPAQPAAIVDQGPLDAELWEHLFPATTLVEPWSFRDFSQRRIRTFPLRWVVAYLRDLYKHYGAEGTVLPEDLEQLRKPLGKLPDVRVPEERPPSTRHPVPGGGGPGPEPSGCLSAILAPLCRLLRPICRPLRRFCRWLRRLLGLGGGAGSGTAKPAPGSVEYRYRPPAPRPDDPFAAVNEAVENHGAVPPFEPRSDKVAEALPEYPVAEAFAQVLLFYDRKGVDGELPPEPVEPRWDFHRRLGALGDYPELMRRLGLVIRLRVPRPASGPARVRVAPRVGGAARPAVDIAPDTACRLDGERFFARPRPGSDLAYGMLDLRDADDRLESTVRAFDLVQVDADGTAMKALVAAASLERTAQLKERLPLGPTPPDPEPLPGTRTAGFAIVRADRAWGLKQRLDRVSDHWQGVAGGLLFADEVVRGYQVWVQREGGAWLSLCEREGEYRPVGEAGEVVPPALRIRDYGYVKRSGASSKDDGSDLYLHEAIVRWAGWSLVAPLPGRTIEADGEVGAVVSESEKNKMRLETRFVSAPESLPSLRFGDKYRFAMAWVDLAGLPLPQLEKGPEKLGPKARVSAPVTYRRFEPVPPPSLLPFGGYRPGASLERLVVRSDFDRDPAQWLAEEKPKRRYQAHEERRVFPPKTSQLMAERHGLFDPAIGGTAAQVAAGFDLAVRERGTFAKPAFRPFGRPREILEPAKNPKPDQHGNEVKRTRTVVNEDTASVLVAPYLPDPLAAGVVLRDVPNLTVAGGVTGATAAVEVVAVPGLANPVLRVRFSGKWPDKESLRVRVAGEDPDAPPHWDEAKRVLTIQLPKAAEATLLYACYLEPGDLGSMGAWDWIDDGDENGDLRAQASQGVHWLLCPWRELTLVHAVQRPLAEPRLAPDTFAARGPNETAATIAGTAIVEVASSGRVDLEASWEEWRDDDPETAEWFTEPRQASIGGWSPLGGAPMPDQRHEFGDTRHRMVRYKLTASSRFREYLPVAEELPGDKPLPLTRPGPERTVSVPASAPPDPPRISHAVPSFGWRLDSGPAPGTVLAVGETLRRRRLGGGLRVFLERPWYSSGEGERLAVVVPGPDEVPPELVSRAGIDPTVGESANPRSRELEAAMFAGADLRDSVLLSERPARVAIASYAPAFDQARGLWACDVAFDMTSLPWGEWPFVRLALARHQPEAIEGARLSKVVTAQWAQLAPDRALSVTRTTANEVSVTLRGRGRLVPEMNRLLVAIERAPGPDPDELDWVPRGATGPAELDADLWGPAVKPQPDPLTGELVWEVPKLPVLPPAAGESLRLAVRELERRPGEGKVGRGAFRITYADDVRLA